MIELFNLRPVSGTMPLSFSNLSFRFPVPPIWSQNQEQNSGLSEVKKEKRKKRPMSTTSILPPIASSDTNHHQALTLPNPDLDLPKTITTTTKKERRMGVLFPSFALFSRWSTSMENRKDNSHRDSTGSARSLFC
ncbi:hypothetical protein BDW59DRAFT_148100 [Aspergillus cavernicola]|uniref:Uncharacterized protein n=1 Tax=Aspergillus cavernicola TaxID=176166 RepID=A0ABR4I8I1_9EURO